jgi:hypothetical protein
MQSKKHSNLKDSRDDGRLMLGRDIQPLKREDSKGERRLML